MSFLTGTKKWGGSNLCAYMHVWIACVHHACMTVVIMCVFVCTCVFWLCVSQRCSFSDSQRYTSDCRYDILGVCIWFAVYTHLTCILMTFEPTIDVCITVSRHGKCFWDTLQVKDHHWLCAGHVFCPSYGPECCVVVSVQWTQPVTHYKWQISTGCVLDMFSVLPMVLNVVW